MPRGIGLLILATVLWGGNYICGRFLADALPPTLLNTIRWAISTVLLAGILAVNKKSFPLIANWKPFAILGFLGVFSFSTLTYLGLHSISASQAGMISAGIPIAILLFTPLILKERIRVKAWIGALVSVAGVIVLFQGKHAAASSGSMLGNLEILLSCFAWGLYTVLGKRYGKTTDPLTLTAGAAFYGTLFSALSCIGTVHADSIHMTGTAWLCVAYVSTFASVGAYLAWNAGVRTVGPGRAAPYINLLPVWTVVFGVILLGEQLSLVSFAGGFITIIGAVLASL
ncbi:DMT family transporter [Paenibacillus thalictri]|uniref:DMT family transporter n=1 Tax=Paenibacillus thalictri TaxID=2527873 RepID=A0A4Q9DK81_9BACL|nr:DMT family transporter [Paenibacillus thalictri]TBL75144.1 DMT family transporter [Paenibacillus thalictri]